LSQKLQDWSNPKFVTGRYGVGFTKPGTFYNTVTVPGDKGKDHLLLSVGHRGPPYSQGGPFHVVHEATRYLDAEIPLTQNWIYWYEGKYRLLNIPGVLPAVEDPWTSLWSQGATSINRARPGGAEAGLGQFLVELRELPRSLAGSWTQVKDGFLANQRPRKSTGSRIGSAHLGVNFGLLPVIRDLQNAYRLSVHLEKRLNQLRRDNGKRVRRRVTVLNDVDTTTTVTVGGSNIAPTNLIVTNPPQVLTTTQLTSTRSWFSGSFRYYIPEVETLRWTGEAISALYGTKLTPELLWEVIPWSWLIDWFTNVGDVIANFSANAAGDLTLEYGYQMYERINRLGHDCKFTIKTNAGPKTLTSGVVRENIVRARGGASPFGFSITPTDLSSRQLGILTALGVSRWG
jgi:hypothetical protein